MWDNLTQDPRRLAIATGVVSSVLSAAAGYLVAVKRLEAKYARIADQDIQDVKRHYALREQQEAKGDLATLAAKYNDTVDGLHYRPSDPDASADEVAGEPEDAGPASEEPEASSIFDSDDPDTYWDYEAELRKRSTNPDRPYIVTHDEYFQGERDYEQTTVTYYEGDGVLADIKEKPIDDDLVGAWNLQRFGTASNDRNIVYVRNEKLELDVEVLRHEGSYSEVVAGFISHSDHRPMRRFRLEE